MRGAGRSAGVTVCVGVWRQKSPCRHGRVLFARPGCRPRAGRVPGLELPYTHTAVAIGRSQAVESRFRPNRFLAVRCWLLVRKSGQFARNEPDCIHHVNAWKKLDLVGRH